MLLDYGSGGNTGGGQVGDMGPLLVLFALVVHCGVAGMAAACTRVPNMQHVFNCTQKQCASCVHLWTCRWALPQDMANVKQLHVAPRHGKRDAELHKQPAVL
jgi:hypothetical protein